MMRDDHAYLRHLPDAAPDPETADAEALQRAFGPPGTRILVIDALRLLPGPVLTDRAGSVVISRLPAIDRAFIDRVAPDVIVAPLFGAAFDILDLIARLHDSAYGGRVVAISAWLPDPEQVAAEIRGRAGRMRVELLALRNTA